MAATHISGPLYVAGVEVIDENGNIDAPVTTTDLTTTGNTILGNGGADTTTLNSTLTVGVNDTGYDVKFFGATAGKYWLWDESADQMLVYGTTYLDGKLNLGLNGGAASASGLLMGVGTTANPAATSAADNMFAEFRTKSTATSGDSRGLYWRHELAGVGVSGESIRAFTKVSAAAATARGAHLSIDLAAAGTVSGFGAGVDAQVLLGAATYSSTLAAVNAEIYAGDATSDIGVGTTSVFRVSVGGDGTGVGNILDNLAFISFTNAAGNGDLVDSAITALTGKAGLRVYVNGSLYGYIPIVTGS